MACVRTGGSLVPAAGLRAEEVTPPITAAGLTYGLRVLDRDFLGAELAVLVHVGAEALERGGGGPVRRAC